MYYFFRGWPARLQDCSKIKQKTGVPRSSFVKHVPTQWLLIGPAAARMIEQWPAIVEYFTVFIPKKNAILMRSNVYKEIAKLLQQSTLKAEFPFIGDSSSLFYLVLFQCKEPMVHEIFMELELLVLTLAGRILKAKAAQKLLEDLSPRPFEDDKNMLPLLEVAASLCDEVQTCLRATYELSKRVFLLSVKKHYASAVKCILKQALNGESSLFLKSLSFLNSGQFSKSNSIGFVVCRPKAAHPSKN